jgi:DNA-binding transcriptional regulator GbsR (MarR family)
VDVDGPGVVMSISLERVAEKYLVAKKLSAGTRKEFVQAVASLSAAKDSCKLAAVSTRAVDRCIANS